MRDPRRPELHLLRHARQKDAREPAPDPAADDVVEAYELGRRRYGARKKKAALARRGITLDRRRTVRIMKEKGLTSAYAKTGFKPHSAKANEAELPNIGGQGVRRARTAHAHHGRPGLRVRGGRMELRLSAD